MKRDIYQSITDQIVSELEKAMARMKIARTHHDARASQIAAAWLERR